MVNINVKNNSDMNILETLIHITSRNLTSE